MIGNPDFALAQATSARRDINDIDRLLVVGGDYVIYAASGQDRETFWIVPLPDVEFLNPADRTSFRVLIDLPKSWISDDELQLSAPAALMQHENALEQLAEGARAVRADLAHLRAQAGDLSSAAGSSKLGPWLKRVRRGDSPQPPCGALVLAVRQGWCTSEWLRDVGLSCGKEPLSLVASSPAAQVEARLYWRDEFMK